KISNFIPAKLIVNKIKRSLTTKRLVGGEHPVVEIFFVSKNFISKRIQLSNCYYTLTHVVIKFLTAFFVDKRGTGYRQSLSQRIIIQRCFFFEFGKVGFSKPPSYYSHFLIGSHLNKRNCRTSFVKASGLFKDVVVNFG